MNTSLDSSDNYEGNDYENSIFWNICAQAIDPVLNNQAHVKFIIAAIGVFINIFHLIVLTRKSMRVYTINLFMISIAICDFLRLLFKVFATLTDYYHQYKTSIMPQDCIPPKSWLPFFLSVHSLTIQRLFQKLSVWFGVAMAVLRVIILKYPLNRRAQRLINSSSGIRILLTVGIPHIPYWFFDLQYTIIQENETWEPPSGCENFSDHNFHMEYSSKPGEYRNETVVFMEGILFTVFPSIILPIATVILIYFLRTLKKSTSSRNHDHNARSTIMVAMVTVTFVIAPVPLLITYLVDFMGLGYRLAFFTIIFSYFCELVSLINGTLHFVLCACISSQYQDAVKQMFGCKKTRITTTTFAS